MSRFSRAGRLGLTAIVAFVFFAVMPVPAVAQPVPISNCPFAIDTPGSYQLTADCYGGIYIFASEVRLDLNWHKVIGSGIWVNPDGRVEHVVISGPGLVKNAQIYINNADYSEVSHVTVVGASVGITAQNCNFLTVNQNVVGRSTYTGVLLSDTSFSSVSNNDTSGNGSYGVVLLGGSTNMVNKNTANGNWAGIALWGGTSNAKVQGNVTTGNLAWGISADGALSAVLFNNSSMANGWYDLMDSPTCSGNEWRNNRFFTSNASCIH